MRVSVPNRAATHQNMPTINTQPLNLVASRLIRFYDRPYVEPKTSRKSNVTPSLLWKSPYGHTVRVQCLVVSSRRMYLLINFGRSSPPQNRQLIVYFCESKYQVEVFVRDLIL